MQRIWQQIVNFLVSFSNLFSSAKLAIFLLIILAIACIIGTIIPEPELCLKYFGKFGAGLIDALSLYDVYHTIWFRWLLGLLVLNLATCSLKRFPKTWRLLRVSKKAVDNKFLQHLSFHKRLTCTIPFNTIGDKLLQAVKKDFRQVEVEEAPTYYILGARRGYLSYLGPYIIHVSILIILIGGIINSKLGFSGLMIIPEGEVSNQIFLRSKSHKTVRLPFALKCNKFILEIYESGMPKAYISKVTVIDGDQRIPKTIEVNGPLDYKGMRFYQASYGIAPQPNLVFKIISREDKKISTVKATFNQPVSLPDNQGTFKVVRIEPNLMGVGPAFQIRLERSKNTEQFWVLERVPRFDALHRQGKYIFVVEDYTRYTGLQVRKNPGIWIIWIGCIILIFGLVISFFVVPQRLWIRAEPKDKGCRVIIGGIAHKRRVAFSYFFETFIKRLKEVIDVEPKGP